MPHLDSAMPLAMVRLNPFSAALIGVAVPFRFLTFSHLGSPPMAKPVTQKIKLLSTAGTGFFYVTKKNPRTSTEKVVFKKYDPVVRKHVEFKETKIK